MIGDFFVMNLFLAMLLDNFSDDDEEKEQDDNANAIEGGEEQAGEGDGDAGESKSEEEKDGSNGSCLGKCFPSASHKHTTEDADVIDFIDIYRSNNVSYKLYNAHTFGFFDPESGIRLFCADLDNSSTVSLLVRSYGFSTTLPYLYHRAASHHTKPHSHRAAPHLTLT